MSSITCIPNLQSKDDHCTLLCVDTFYNVKRRGTDPGHCFLFRRSTHLPSPPDLTPLFDVLLLVLCTISDIDIEIATPFGPLKRIRNVACLSDFVSPTHLPPIKKLLYINQLIDKHSFFRLSTVFFVDDMNIREKKSNRISGHENG